MSRAFLASWEKADERSPAITNMLKSNMDILTVRDQARHSSILITDIYTPKDIKEANKLIVRFKGEL